MYLAESGCAPSSSASGTPARPRRAWPRDTSSIALAPTATTAVACSPDTAPTARRAGLAASDRSCEHRPEHGGRGPAGEPPIRIDPARPWLIRRARSARSASESSRRALARSTSPAAMSRTRDCHVRAGGRAPAERRLGHRQPPGRSSALGSAAQGSYGANC